MRKRTPKNNTLNTPPFCSKDLYYILDEKPSDFHIVDDDSFPCKEEETPRALRRERDQDLRREQRDSSRRRPSAESTHSRKNINRAFVFKYSTSICVTHHRFPSCLDEDHRCVATGRVEEEEEVFLLLFLQRLWEENARARAGVYLRARVDRRVHGARREREAQPAHRRGNEYDA